MQTFVALICFYVSQAPVTERRRQDRLDKMDGTALAKMIDVRVIYSNLEKRTQLRSMIIIGYILAVLLISGLARA
jgi:hypothetical protein